MRTLLLGIDGADPELMERWELPHMESIGEGFQIDTHGNSGPSWASVMTGLRPQEHGVFKLEPQQDEQSWQGTPIWEKVDGYSGVANVPLTYPPDTDINGWMVTGLFTPRNAIYTSPRNLYKKLDELGYRIDVWIDNHQNHPHGHYGTIPFDFDQEYKEEILSSLEDVIEKRGDCFKWLLENEPVDFSFLCFTSLDRVQHLAFDDQERVREFYEMMDEQVGKVLNSDAVTEDTEIFLTSDHGFRRIDMPDANLTGEHRMEGYGAVKSDRFNAFKDLEDLHECVVASANRTDVEDRLEDLGYL